MIDSLHGKRNLEKRQYIKQIFRSGKKIQEFPIGKDQIDLLVKLYNAMSREELTRVSAGLGDQIHYYIGMEKKRIIKKIIDIINVEQRQTNDIEELKRLKGSIIPEMVKDSSAIIGSTKIQIERKINKLQQQALLEKKRRTVPKNIKSIIVDLAQGRTDILQANAIIDEEVRKRLEKMPKSKFALTEEQVREQILVQIRFVLKERAKEYKIENPVETVLQLESLCDGNIESAMNTVVQNLVNRKEYEKAESVCNNFYIKGNNDKSNANIVDLRKKIRYAQLGDFVLKGITRKSTPKKEKEYVETLEKKLQEYNINPEAISLGKSQDGARNITLFNIINTKEFTH